jgi:hypothetical protein
MAGKTITLAAWNACARQADMARLMGVVGKSFRDITRRVFGVYVNSGDPLDARLRAYLFAFHITLAGDKDARLALVHAWRDGDTFADEDGADAARAALAAALAS